MARRTLDTMVPSDDLVAAVAAGRITRKPHPDYPISIYTYTRSCQYDHAWDAATIACRGLIADDATGHIIALPFPKFFNVADHAMGHPYAPPLPDQPFQVHDKVDGSLGICFHYAGAWHVASKGSFTSDQAAWATGRLRAADTSGMDPDVTYLAEIVYPGNRIVVDYGIRQDLVLLGAFRRDGTELPLDTAAAHWGTVGSVVRSWPALPLADLMKLMAANTRLDGAVSSGIDAEGYVIRFASGVRAKVKLADYVRLHKTLTGITDRDVWRYLGIQRFAGQDTKRVAQSVGCTAADVAAMNATGRGPFDALLDQVPDEFDSWVRKVADSLNKQAADLGNAIDAAFDQLRHLGDDRAQFARAAQQIKDRSVRAAMFLILDGRPVDLHIWRSIKPGPGDPFKSDDDG